MSLYSRRRRSNAVTMVLSIVATVIGATWLVVILATLLWNGFSGLSVAVFTENTPPPGSSTLSRPVRSLRRRSLVPSSVQPSAVSETGGIARSL